MDNRKESLWHCSFPAWYPHFKHVTFHSRIINLPPDFVHLLVADNVSAALLDRAVRAELGHAFGQHFASTVSSTSCSGRRRLAMVIRRRGGGHP